MECGICSHKFDKQRQPVCPSCTRSSAYPYRVGQVSSLLDKERLHRCVATVLRPPLQLRTSQLSSASQVVELTESARKLETARHRDHIKAIDARLDAIKEQQHHLMQQIDDARKEAAERRSDHVHRRETLQTATARLHKDGKQHSESVQVESRLLQHRLDKILKRTVQGRQKLCLETAVLTGLRRKRGRTRSGVTLPDSVTLGRLPIPDLRELNTVHPDIINASLDNIARLLVTTTHYLGVRLPAEVIAPHDNFPHAAIYSLHSSYRANVGKLRPLHISKPLPLLAKDESATYNLFVDGLVLLAYDIAWLCRTQGLVAVKSWEDLCAMGTNLYDLFVAKHAQNGLIEGQGNTEPLVDGLLPQLGDYSHANAMADTTNHQVSNAFSKWEMPSLARIVDKLRSHLLTEMSGAEWEVLDEKEWEEEREDEQAVLVGGARWSLAAGAASRMGISYMTAAQDPEDGEGKVDNVKGWMKLKVRSGESTE